MNSVYVIIDRDRGDGFHRISTGGRVAYPTYELAMEDVRRCMFPAGLSVLELPVATEPMLLGTEEQRKAWEEKEKKRK